MTSPAFGTSTVFSARASSGRSTAARRARPGRRSTAGGRSGALLVALALCQAPFFGAAAASAATLPREQARVVAALESMYRAAAADDLTLFHAVAAPDFYAFDNGKRFDGDALMRLIKDLHAAGKVYVWSVTEPQVRIFRDTAFVTYVNRGSIEDRSGKKDLAWLESALLRKGDGRWRILFLHSTRVP